MSQLTPERTARVLRTATTPAAKLVLLTLTERADDDAVAIAGTQELADELGLAKSGVFYAIEKLRDSGLITDLEPEVRRKTRRRWRINYDALPVIDDFEARVGVVA